MPIEIGPLAPVRPVRTQPFAATPAETGSRARAAPPELAVESEAQALAAAPPVERERVAKIRAAIAEGSYPLVPARIADAMIAAGLMLSLGK